MSKADVFSNYFPMQSETICKVPRVDITDSLASWTLYKESALFSECHKRMVTYPCTVCGYVHYLPVRCDLRICPECGKSRHGAYVLGLNKKIMELTEAAPRGYRLRMFTLTSPKLSVDEWSSEVYDKMMKWRSSFMQHKNIKPKILGALCCVETKYSVEGESYFKKRSPDSEYKYQETGLHVHIHGLALSKYIDNSKHYVFSNTWKSVTKGEARIAHIELVDNSFSAISEVTKYLYKPSILGSADNYARYVVYSKGRRLNTTYGSFRKLDLKRPRVRLACAECGNKLFMDETLDRPKAAEKYEAQEHSKDSLLRYTEGDKPVLPDFKPKK